MNYVGIRTQFIGFHRWLEAPEEVKFLKDWHRHIFYIKLEVPVEHDDRDMEFFMLKKQVTSYVRSNYENKQFDLSCENIANALGKIFKASKVVVSEDNENYGIYERQN